MLIPKPLILFITTVILLKNTQGRTSGEAQDNQYKDVVDFLIYGSLYNKVGACVDGWYWEEHGKKQELKELFRDNQNVIICSAEDIKGGHI